MPDEQAGDLGRKLQARRKGQGLTLQDVADATDLSKGFLSRLERGHSSISVAALVKVCQALNTPIAALFETAGGVVVRAEEAPSVNFGGERVEDVLLTPTKERNLQVLLSEVAPGGGSGDEAYELDGFEVAHVLSGELEISVDDERYRLKAGDTLTFDGGRPHSWGNRSRTRAAKVIWALTPAA